MDQRPIFLSAVSREFGTVRDRLANRLHGARFSVMVQREFLQAPAALTLLRKLHDYIKGCTTVVCLIGMRSGHFPTDAEAAELTAECPNILPTEIDRASYTQWEFFLGRHYRRRMLTYRATDAFGRDTTGAADPEQTAFLSWLERHGIDLTPVDSAGDFQAEAMASLQEFTGGPRPDNLPYRSIGRLFIGRNDFLPRIRESLRRAAGGATAIVHGLGGIGKTRAAVEYALRHADEYTALLFLRAGDPAALDSQIAALAGVLLLPEDASPDDRVRHQAVLAWLGSHPGWLLILDSADTPEAVRAADTLARRLRLGHVILTSRLSEFPLGIESLGLDLLTLEDAAEYLLTATEGDRRAEPDDAMKARELAEALDRLTLGLVHAGAYIKERRFTFARYLTEWHANRGKVLDWANETVTGYKMSLAQTWVTSEEQLTESGRALLERLSFFANDPVPEFLLDVPVPGEETANGLEPLLDLQRFSLIARDMATERFTVHRIVRDVTNRRLATDPGSHHTRLVDAVSWLNAAFDGDPDDVRTWAHLDPLAPHAETLARAADAAGIADPTARLMGELGVLFGAKAQYGRAEPLYRRALAIDEARLGPDYPTVATRLGNLAALLQDTNRLAEAEPLCRRALAIGEASLGPDHPDVAIRLNNLALLLRDTNRLAEAEPLARRALAIDETSLGPDHPNVATRLNNLAELLRTTNRLAEAEPLCRRALAIGEASLGPDHPDVAIRLNNLALLLRDTNRLAEAEPLFRRALAIGEASLGPDHPTVATHLNNLAKLFQATNRLAEAEPLMRRMVATFLAFERGTGHAHPHRDAALQNYADLLTALGYDETAIRAAIESARHEAGLG